MNRLFVYGIFLNQYNRDAYGMSNPNYETIKDYVTIACTSSGHIVQAVPVPDSDVYLTGLLVDVDPTRWADIDRLESGYDRVKVKTTTGKEAWMYVRPERKASHE